MSTLRRTLIVVIVVGGVACSRPQAEPEWEPPIGRGPTRVEVMRGLLHELSPGRVTFVPCGRNLHLDVVDGASGDLSAARSDLAPSTADAIYVELRVERGVRADDWRNELDRKIVVLEVRRALPAGAFDPCATPLAQGDVRASGNEPAWSVAITRHGIEWAEPDLETPLVFPPATVVLDGERRTWASRIAGPPGRSISVALTPGRCKDSVSGAWFPSRADVTLDDRPFEGCGLAED